MNKKEIQKQIDNAVRIFKESLEKTYLEKGKTLHGIGLHPLQKIFTGKITMNRKANGNLRISGELPSIVFNKECKGLPRNMEDYAIYPLVITLFHEKEVIDNEK